MQAHTPPHSLPHDEPMVYHNAIRGHSTRAPQEGGAIEAWRVQSKVRQRGQKPTGQVPWLESRACTISVVAAALVAIAVLAGVLGWHFSRDQGENSSNTVGDRARGQIIAALGTVAVFGLSPSTDLSRNGAQAEDLCFGLEELLSLPAGACSITQVLYSANQTAGHDISRRLQADGTGNPVGGIHRFDFLLLLPPEHLPELDENEVKATVVQNIQDAFDSLQLESLLRSAGSGALSSLLSVQEVTFLTDDDDGQPTASASASPQAAGPSASGSPLPSTTPSATPGETPSPDPTPSASPSSLPSLQPLPAPGTGPLRVAQALPLLPLSKQGTLIRLFRTKRDRPPAPEGDAVPVPCGRSYDGHTWEPQPPCFQQFTCGNMLDGEEHCRANVSLSDGFAYWVEVSGRAAPSHAERASRFLVQASFGGTAEDIHGFPSQASSSGSFDEDAKSWIIEQMDAPVSLHRAHYRRLANPRSPGDTLTGRPREACEEGSRWIGFAVTQFDQGSVFTFVNETLYINGYPRTHIEGIEMPPEVGPGPWRICYVQEWVGGYIQYATLTSPCQYGAENPVVDFPAGLEPPSEYVSTTASGMTVVSVERPARDAFVLENPPPADQCSARRAGPVFMRAAVEPAGPGAPTRWLQLQRRLRLVQNSPESPATRRAPDSSACPTAPKTPMNAHLCKIVPGCGAPRIEPSTASIVLNDSTIRSIYEESGIYAYYVTGLRMDEEPAPCEESGSRWQRVQASECADAAVPGGGSVDAETLELLSGAIAAADGGDFNAADVVDIHVAVGEGSSCTLAAKGIRVNVNDSSLQTSCWQHVHRDERSVLDFSYWTRSHPGNQNARNLAKRNPITAVAERGDVEIPFPAWHSMSQWNERRSHHAVFGRRNSRIALRDLPADLLTPDMLERAGAALSDGADPLDDAVEVCASPGEVANDPQAGSKYTMALDGNVDVVYYDLDVFAEGIKGDYTKSNVWINTVLEAPDQLRQRIAWALEQLLVINEGGTDRRLDAEVYAAYHDIFVRNAFGNYGDILREVAYSPMMGTMLTYQGSFSLYLIQDLIGQQAAFPDENFAREILQLFTIGLWELNLDGTRKVDQDGNHVPTYTNKDILEYSRAWTGLAYESWEIFRSNIEAIGGKFTPTGVDSMRALFAQARDSFPKHGLRDSYIGDYRPACWDLPRKHFLRPGARYHFLGTDPMPKLHTDPDDMADSGTKRMVLNETTSALFALLCGESGEEATCSGSMRSLVELNSSIRCDGAECDADTLRVVQLNRGQGRKPIFYEYERPPCVEFAFVEDGRGLPTTLYTVLAMCVDERAEAAAGSCCPHDGSFPQGRMSCGGYQGERMRYATAVSRCEAKGQAICESVFPQVECGHVGHVRAWGTTPCTTAVRVFPDGRVQAVHELPEGHYQNNRDPRVNLLRDNYKYRVGWRAGRFPQSGSDPLAGGNCSAASAGTLLCTASVTASPVFSDVPGSLTEIKEKLFVGAPDPSLDADMNYAECQTTACIALNHDHGVRTFLKAGSGPVLNAETVFAAKFGGRDRFLLNVQHSVMVSDSYSFRNPPVMMTVWEDTIRNVYHETDAAIDHYMQHPNVPPFLASFFIKRLVTSNPSPRYVRAVAQAFIDGEYRGIGSGEYGDMASTIAAVLLDPEALSPTLEADPAHGKLREPLLKVIHLFRALELESNDGNVVELFELERKLGQLPFKSPSVFNFYQDDFQPQGSVVDASLTAPEAQILNTPTAMSWLNGILSLLRYGLTSCERGFGARTWAQQLPGTSCNDISRGAVQNPGSLAAANLTWTPEDGDASAAVIDELDLLLTGGRMSNETKIIMQDTLDFIFSNPEFDANDITTAAVQLAATAPEFHTQGAGHDGPNPRSSELPTNSNTTETMMESDDYKLLVFLNLNGGCDSFNMIVPLSGCSGGEDVYSHYQDVRGDVALPQSELLGIDVAAGSQPCTRFGVHKQLSLVKDLYDEGEAAFVANIGPLVQPVTKTQVEEGIAELPPQLFAHNVQTKATQSVHAQEAASAGVLGRIRDALWRQGMSGTTTYSISGNSIAVQGEPGEAPSPDIIDPLNGAVPFDERGKVPHLSGALEALVRNGSTSFMADTWSRQVAAALDRSKVLSQSIASNGTLMQPFEASVPQPNQPPSAIALQLEQAARLVAARKALGSRRDLVFVELGGFDSHSDLFDSHNRLFAEVNAALDSFVQEMKLQGVWGNTTIVQASEFARTLTSNGAGTDHGWGGNVFVAGGALKGGKILGTYPSDLSEDGELNIGRGRVIPTLGWEGLWNAVVRHFGVANESVPKVLPNLGRFEDGQVIQPGDLFEQSGAPAPF